MLWAVRKRCGMSLREAGALAGGMKPGAVSIAIKRLEEKASKNSKIKRQMDLLLKRVDA